MALNRENVHKAWYILNEINPNARNSFVADFKNLRDQLQEDTIIGYGKKSDDGWENIFMNVKEISPEQLEIFERRKKEVHNSSFIDREENGVTRIGWF